LKQFILKMVLQILTLWMMVNGMSHLDQEQKVCRQTQKMMIMNT